MPATRDSLTVLHIDTERGWRGGERQVLWLAESLARAGHRSIVGARRGEQLARRCAARGIDVVPLTPHSELALRSAALLRRVIRRQRVDVVHAHTGHAVALAALATLGSSVPMVLTRRVVFRLRDNALTRWKYRRARRVIAISRAVADTLARSGIEPGRIVVVPSGVDLAREVAPASDALLHELGARARPLVIMVAALTPEKDPLTFVRAIAVARQRVPQLAALVVGDGPMRGAVAAEVERLSLGDTIHLTGLRSDADALMAAADLVALTSTEEGLGSVLLDAAVFGKPTVATRAGGIPEIVQHGVTGLLVPPGDADALGVSMARVLNDPAFHAQLAEGALRRAADFSLASTADRTLAVYLDALER